MQRECVMIGFGDARDFFARLRSATAQRKIRKTISIDFSHFHPITFSLFNPDDFRSVVAGSLAFFANRRRRTRFCGGVPSPRPHKQGSVSFFSTSSKSIDVSAFASSMSSASAAAASSPPPPAELVAAAARANQSHLFDDWEHLSEAQRERRAADVAAIDFSALAVALSAALGKEEGEASATTTTSTAARNAGCSPWDSVVPLWSNSPSSEGGDEVGTDQEQLARWEEAGLRAAAAGELAVVVLAGGQGTRLGSSKPKGCFDLGNLPCGTPSLFGLHAKRVLSLRRRAGKVETATREGEGGGGNEEQKREKSEERLARVDLYVMTSDATHAETVAHFEQHDFFGLGAEGVFFFRQGTMPCVTEEGKVIVGPKGVKEGGGGAGERAAAAAAASVGGGGIAASPDGNGGLYAALVASGALDRMERRGALFADVVCVDNALASPGDPAFVGACVSAAAEVGCRAVRRERPDEKVGVFARESRKEGDSRLRVLEYSELDPEKARAVDAATGRPLFGWANVCMHFFSTRFLRSAAADLGCGPVGRALYHCARKPIPSHCAASGSDVSVPGIKLELFIFDAFDAVPEERVLVCGVARADAFAPVKNADVAKEVGVIGADTPAAAREALLARRARVGEERGF